VTTVEFIQRCLDQNYHSFVYCLEDLTSQELSWRPNSHSMSIGFIAWHCCRIKDMWILERCMDVPQLWEESWAGRMGRLPANHLDNGSRFTEEQLEEFQVPPLPMLLDYAKEANDKAVEYLQSINDDTLDNTVIMALRGEIGLSTMFQQIIWEFNQHGGQMAYLKGMQRGMQPNTYTGGVLP